MTTDTMTFDDALTTLEEALGKDDAVTDPEGIMAMLGEVREAGELEAHLAQVEGTEEGARIGRRDAKDEEDSTIRGRIKKAYERTHPKATSSAWWYDRGEPWATLSEGLAANG